MSNREGTGSSQPENQQKSQKNGTVSGRKIRSNPLVELVRHHGAVGRENARERTGLLDCRQLQLDQHGLVFRS